jgi:C4-dicarboxylate-specific signal transduction histidine kinase
VLLKLKNRISLKVLLIEILGLTAVLVPKSAIDLSRQNDQMQKDFDVELALIETSLYEGLVNPLWNFSPEDAQAPLSAALISPHVRAVQVFDSNSKVFASSSDSDFNLPLLQGDRSPVAKLLFRDVNHRDRKIGRIIVYYSDEDLIASMRSNFIETFFAKLLSIALILLITFFLIERNLIKKIYKLRAQAELLRSKKLDTSFAWPTGDEIDSLGQSLEDSRKTLLSLFDNLEKLVAERSEKLVESSRLASLGEMAGSIAHEINNPLAIISGKAHRLRGKVNRLAPDEQADFKNDLEVIDRTVDRVAKIIQGLRTISREGSTDDYSVCSLSDLVEESLALCRARFAAKGVDIRVAPLPPGAAIECRSVQIAQVLLNLLNNAFDAVEDLPNRWVSLEVRLVKESIEICVTDSGQGIPKHVVDKMMQPFFTTKPVGKGTGLGLSISRSIAMAHNGDLRVDQSHPNTRFVLRLPMAQELLKAA